MDVPPIADVTPERLVAPPAPSPAPDVDRRLASLEARLADVGERLDALSTSLDASVRAAVAQEVQAASGELRHTVAELGRLLVRDLGRLSKILSEHRDHIVAELRSPASSTDPGAAAAPDGDDRADAERGGAEVTSGEPNGDAELDQETAGEKGDAGDRQRRTLLRRRQG